MAVSQPSMHRCLSIPELVPMVCERVENKQDLLHLALTCRHLCPASLDALWADTGLGIVPLLRCFPEGVLRVHKRRGGHILVTLKRLPSLQEWERVRLYASRMKHLIICDQYRCRWAPEKECYRLFLDHWPYPTQYIFPQVRIVELEVPFPPGTMFFAAIAGSLTPPLSGLTLMLGPYFIYAPSLDFLDECLDTCAGTLTSFHVHSSLSYSGDEDNADPLMQIVDYIGNAFATCSALRVVKTYLPLHSAAMMYLAHLTNLTDLTFAFHANYRAPQLLEPHPENFRHLRTLSITMNEDAELDDLCVFLANLRSHSLDTLSITFDHGPLVTRLFDLMRTIARFGSLRSLKLKGDAWRTSNSWQPEDPDDWPISYSRILEALLPLPRLRKFTVSALPLHITGADIERAGCAWPDLEVLDLSPEDERTTTTVSVADIHMLAAACPRLRKVRLQVTGSGAMHDAGEGAANQYPCMDVIGLYTHGDPETEVKDALLHMFPNARITYIDVAGFPRDLWTRMTRRDAGNWRRWAF